MALLAVYIAAIVTSVAGLVYSIAAHAWGKVCVRRWDEGIDQ